MSDFSAMLEEIREYFYYKYFSPDLAILQNFNGTEIERFLPYLIIGICGGIFIAAIATYYSSDFLGRPVRRLYKAGAFAPENAKTLGEIGCDQAADPQKPPSAECAFKIRGDRRFKRKRRPDAHRAFLSARKRQIHCGQAVQTGQGRLCHAVDYACAVRDPVFPFVILCPGTAGAGRQRYHDD